MQAIHYNVTIFITFKAPNVRGMPDYVAMLLALETSSSFIIMLIIEGGVIVAVSCCTMLSFSTSDMASLSVCSPFSYIYVGG